MRKQSYKPTASNEVNVASEIKSPTSPSNPAAASNFRTEKPLPEGYSPGPNTCVMYWQIPGIANFERVPCNNPKLACWPQIDPTINHPCVDLWPCREHALAFLKRFFLRWPVPSQVEKYEAKLKLLSELEPVEDLTNPLNSGIMEVSLGA